MSSPQEDPKSLVFCLAEQPLNKDVWFSSQTIQEVNSREGNVLKQKGRKNKKVIVQLWIYVQYKSGVF